MNPEQDIDTVLEELIAQVREDNGQTVNGILTATQEARKSIKDIVTTAMLALLDELNDAGEIHHSTYDYRTADLPWSYYFAERYEELNLKALKDKQ